MRRSSSCARSPEYSAAIVLKVVLSTMCCAAESGVARVSRMAVSFISAETIQPPTLNAECKTQNAEKYIESAGNDPADHFCVLQLADSRGPTDLPLGWRRRG